MRLAMSISCTCGVSWRCLKHVAQGALQSIPKDSDELKCIAADFLKKISELARTIKHHFRSKTILYAGIAMNWSYIQLPN